jgi:hypothetical protein
VISWLTSFVRSINLCQARVYGLVPIAQYIIAFVVCSMLLINQPLFCVCEVLHYCDFLKNYSVTNSMGFLEETFFYKTFLETSKKKIFCHISMHGLSWSPKLYEDLFLFFHILLIVKLG